MTTLFEGYRLATEEEARELYYTTAQSRKETVLWDDYSCAISFDEWHVGPEGDYVLVEPSENSVWLEIETISMPKTEPVYVAPVKKAAPSLSLEEKVRLALSGK